MHERCCIVVGPFSSLSSLAPLSVSASVSIAFGFPCVADAVILYVTPFISIHPYSLNYHVIISSKTLNIFLYKFLFTIFHDN